MPSQYSRKFVSLVTQSVKGKANKIIFLSGAAGTGKTTLIKEINEKIPKSVIVTPTGISALTAGGQTIHSFFKIPPAINPKLSKVKGGMAYNSIKNLDCLIIDEISMVRSDLFDAIDQRLQMTKNNGKPFGGASIIIAGDPYQLDPVLKKSEEAAFYHPGYGGVFFFDSFIFKQMIKGNKFEAYELQNSFRQRDDGQFVELLDNIRLGRNISQTIVKFNDISVKNVNRINLGIDDSFNKENVITLTTINDIAESINNEKLEALPGEDKKFIGKKTGKFLNDQEKNLPAPEILCLKEGAKVLFVKNDEDRRWVNGSQGVVTKIPDDKNFIEIDLNGTKCHVTTEKWEKIIYEYDDELDVFHKKVTGTYEQYPLRLGWALTIHRSQSLTLDKCVIDFGEGAFTHGQAYVALSRTRSINDIILLKGIKEEDIQIHPSVKKFYENTEFYSMDNGEMITKEGLKRENIELREQIDELKRNLENRRGFLDDPFGKSE
jgi:ATP-dependent exoDNAse (exonuclease V) alpha subunit